MGTAELAGKRVLEIGCGMGLHAEMLARAGAVLTAVDISDVSVAATRQRFDLKHLSADLLRLDAETLPFGDATFDLVWSWGVIHHSAHTGRIVKEIARVLKPGGTAKLMVYNLGGTAAYVTLMLRHSWAFWLKRRSLDETLWASSDGFMARFYTKDLFMDCLSTFFTHVDIGVLGQEADAIPLPRALRGWVRRLISEAALRRLASERGAFLYATART
jgi:ubiquinone/menaquinone biosynthesis C-methylase UbiE